jgi:hypothetical protein
VHRIFLGLLILLLPGPATSAQTSENLLQPFAIRNLNPFFGIYGIPAQQSPAVVGHGQSSMQVQLDVVSHFTDAENDREFIAIDGETYRLAFRFARGLGDRWEIGTEIPLISHSGGTLDGLINNWHDFWGLPTLGRDQGEDGLLNFRYVRDGQNLVDVQASGTGIGDVLLFTGKTLEQTGRHTVTLRGQLKLPAGDPDNLRGSGGVDAAISATASSTWGEKVSFSGRIGAAYLGKGDVLPDLQQHWAGFGTAFIGWQAFKPLSFKAQLDVQSPLYENSGFDQLTDTAIQLTFGASVRLGRASFLDLSFTEDEFNPDVSSDFSFQIRLRAVR